jgi:hypothetical protein
MPWHWKAMKVAASCEKPRGGASILLSGDYRIGKPTMVETIVSITESIGNRSNTRGIETS